MPGLQYKNVVFKGDSVVFKNDYKEHKSPAELKSGLQPEDTIIGDPLGTEYAQVEMVRPNSEASGEIQPVCKVV